MYYLSVYLPMRAFFLILTTIVLVQPDILAAEMIISGIYQGKDLYVQNPYSPADKNYCTLSVYVNGEERITNPNTSAYRINLSYLNVNENVEIKIVHLNNCVPKILNPDVIKPVGEFKFKTANATRNAISWLTQGELPNGRFIITRRLPEGEWKDIAEVIGKGNILTGSYQVAIEHKGGENYYRIRYESAEGKKYFSPVIDFKMEEEPVTFYPVRVINKIFLSREAEYLVTDKEGNKYLEGKKDFINVRNLPPGNYILHIQNREEPFIKKRIAPKKKSKKEDSLD